MLNRSICALDLEIMVNSQYRSVIYGQEGQSLMCRATSKFDKSIFTEVFFDMCGFIGCSSQSILDFWLLRYR